MRKKMPVKIEGGGWGSIIGRKGIYVSMVACIRLLQPREASSTALQYRPASKKPVIRLRLTFLFIPSAKARFLIWHFLIFRLQKSFVAMLYIHICLAPSAVRGLPTNRRLTHVSPSPLQPVSLEKQPGNSTSEKWWLTSRTLPLQNSRLVDPPTKAICT